MGTAAAPCKELVLQGCQNPGWGVVLILAIMLVNRFAYYPQGLEGCCLANGQLLLSTDRPADVQQLS